MIDLEKAIKEFYKYTNQFDTKNPNIQRKIGHSIRVMQLSKKMAIKEELTKEEIEVATLIGLLHDIGRFEQYTKYKTYKDKVSIDHGDLGVEILFDKGKIKNFITDEKYYNIIKKAIKNHNKYELETKDISNKEEMFCKIIRDADKIDILYQGTEIFWKGQEEIVEEESISEKVWKSFLEKRLIDNQIRKTQIDQMIRIISFIYDINFKESYKIIKEKNYINQIINRFNYKDEETKQKMKEIQNIVEKYLEEKTK